MNELRIRLQGDTLIDRTDANGKGATADPYALRDGELPKIWKRILPAPVAGRYA